MSIMPSTTTIDHPINNEVMKSLGKIGNSCTNDYFCRRAVSQSHCYNGKCSCIDGYTSTDQYSCMKSNCQIYFNIVNIHLEFLIDVNEQTTIKSTLMPVDYKSLLGGKCLTKRNCHTSNAVCLDSICTCPKSYFPIDDWTCLLEPGMK
jgi:hypothetical protein